MRIAAEPALTVHLVIAGASPASDVRAMTRMTRNARGASVRCHRYHGFAGTEELIAHEFEHIIEQLDGVDLAARAALRHTGVTPIGHAADMFETTRAQRAGLKVVSELGR